MRRLVQREQRVPVDNHVHELGGVDRCGAVFVQKPPLVADRLPGSALKNGRICKVVEVLARRLPPQRTVSTSGTRPLQEHACWPLYSRWGSSEMRCGRLENEAKRLWEATTHVLLLRPCHTELHCFGDRVQNALAFRQDRRRIQPYRYGTVSGHNLQTEHYWTLSRCFSSLVFLCIPLTSLSIGSRTDCDTSKEKKSSQFQTQQGNPKMQWETCIPLPNLRSNEDPSNGVEVASLAASL